MSREPYQILVFLRKHIYEQDHYLVLKRADMHVWQGVAGGGEDGEAPKEAAARETLEETGMQIDGIRQLSSVAMLPVLDVVGKHLWGADVEEIPEYSFVADVDDDATITLSGEHEDGRWCDYDEAMELLEWESNRAALREIATA